MPCYPEATCTSMDAKFHKGGGGDQSPSPELLNGTEREREKAACRSASFSLRFALFCFVRSGSKQSRADRLELTLSATFFSVKKKGRG